MNRSQAVPIAVIAAAVLVALGDLFGIKRAPSPLPVPPIIITVAVTPTGTPSPTPTSTPTPAPTHGAPTGVPPSLHTGPPSSGLSTVNVSTQKGVFTATILSLDLSQVRVITDTGNDGDCTNNCTVMSLAGYVSKNGGFAGINGTYFCPATYPDCSSKTNSYDFPVYNTRLGHWINSRTLFWNSRSIFYTDGSGAHFLQDSSGFSGGLTAGIINYPGLVSGGNVQIDDNQSGMSDKQKSVGTKVGIGLRDSTHIMVVVAQNVNMQQFAYVFKALGATGALNLDTGGSLALISNGRYVMGPGRDLPNAIIFAAK